MARAKSTNWRRQVHRRRAPNRSIVEPGLSVADVRRGITEQRSCPSHPAVVKGTFALDRPCEALTALLKVAIQEFFADEGELLHI